MTYFWRAMRPNRRPAQKHIVESPIEVEFWRAHERARYGALRGLVKQYKVGQYRLDFAIPAARIGIELDGHATHSTTYAIAADRRRQRALEANGWRIIRFGGLEVWQNPDQCVAEAAKLAALYRKRRLHGVPRVRQRRLHGHGAEV
jgi:very-short-patch-repair endonuclease